MDSVECSRLREQWTEAIARAVGTLSAGQVVEPPVELVELFERAMRIHILELAPAAVLVDAMEDAWWTTSARSRSSGAGS